MGVDTGDFDGSGKPGVAITNFDNENDPACIGATAPGVFDDVSIHPASGGIQEHSRLWLHVPRCGPDGALDWRWPMATSTKPSEISAATPVTPNRRNSF